MLNKNSRKKVINISAGVVLGILISPGFLSPAQVLSQTTSGDQDLSGSWLMSESFSPPSRGAPGSAAAGGSRGCGCEPGQKFLAPLVPSDAMAFTVSEYPRFFWYVSPGSSLGESSAERPLTVRFALIDGNENMVYVKKLSVPSSGIMSHQLSPEDAAPLAENKQYHWLVTMVCDTEDASADPFIDGWVERIPVSEELQAELDNATENDRPSIYAREGIWHEALTTLAELRQQNPQDETIVSRWSELLRSVNLGDFTEEPLIMEPEEIAEPKPTTEMSQTES
jgi:hypothetical protein